jgi:hypothetical protein
MRLAGKVRNSRMSIWESPVERICTVWTPWQDGGNVRHPRNGARQSMHVTADCKRSTPVMPDMKQLNFNDSASAIGHHAEPSGPQKSPKRT